MRQYHAHGAWKDTVESRDPSDLLVKAMAEDPELKVEGFRTQESMQDLARRCLF